MECRDVVKFSNPGVLAVMWWNNLPPLVGLGLTELPISRGAKAPPAPPLNDGSEKAQKGGSYLRIKRRQ